MSKVLIMSDVHADLGSLQAVLRSVADHDLDAVWCAGDMVGYGPEPNECLDLLRSLGAVCIRGNHERFVLGIDDGADFSAHAYETGMWTKSVLTEENRNWLMSLQDEIALPDGTILSHGAPGDPGRYLFGTWELMEVAGEVESRVGPGIVVVGHTHHSGFGTADEAQIPGSGIVKVDRDRRFVVNPGSVGRRSGHASARSFVLFDRGSCEIVFLSAPGE